MANNGVKIVCGLNVLLSDSTTIEQTREWLDVLEKEGIDTIDTAQVYGPSERLLGEAGASSRFIIDTKHCGGAIPGQSTMERVIARGLESIENLKTDSVRWHQVFFQVSLITKASYEYMTLMRYGS